MVIPSSLNIFGVCSEVHTLTNLYFSILFLIKIKEEFTPDEVGETSNSLTKNSQNPPSSNLLPDSFSDAGWDDQDDACFLEATEDAEFADAADRSLLGYKSAMDDIPDELIIEALQSS
ncbi:primase and polymerase (DNA-directed) [Cricetulus griseus]